MAERSHLSIGEVLTLLRDEFPDVTISKIRFLESQGLVDPERTPSGYRKFYEHDVERLRWILRQQRENFLPLKVIRGRLTEHGDELEGHDAEMDLAMAEEGVGLSDEDALAPAGLAAARTGHPAAGRGASSARAAPAGAAPAGAAPASAAPASPAAPGNPATTTEPAPKSRSSAPASSGHRPRLATPSLFAEDPQAPARPEPGTAAPGPAARKQPAHRGRRSAPSEEGESYSAEELAAAAGCQPALVGELAQYGLISAHAVVAGTSYFDEGALAVAEAAAQFTKHGVEVRHLRAWRNAADREASLFEQLVLPMLRQRNPEARRQAAETLQELARLGGELRTALVEQAVRDIR